MRPQTRALVSILMLASVLALPATAQLPTSQLAGLFPAGAAPDSTLEVTIAGANLDDTDKLLFSNDGIRAVAKLADPTPFDEHPRPIPNVFTVTVAADVPPGRYEVRSYGKYGLSNPRTFVIGTLKEFVEQEPNGGGGLPEWNDIDDGQGGKQKVNPAMEVTLPATVNGQSGGGADVDWFRFQGTSGQRVLLDGYARRIDSQMDLILTLCKSDGTVIAESRKGACDDPVIDATLPDNGVYFIKVHDALYRNGTTYYYRLNIGGQPYVDFVFPPAGLAGSNDEYTLYGCNLPGGQPSGLEVEGNMLETANVRIAIPAEMDDKLQFSSFIGPHQAGMDGIEYRIANGGHQSNPILITTATAPVIREQPDNNTPESAQNLTPPCEVAGRFYPQRDVDWYSFEAKAGEVWAFDLVSQRLGIPTDPSLLIQRVVVNDNGEKQVSDIQFIDDVQEQNFRNQSGRHEFDYRTTDPSYLFTAPADATYRVLVRDGHSSVKTDPRLVYRLAIRKPAPDFRIVAVPGGSSGSLLLRRGGRQVVRVFVFRRDGYDGEIRVSCSGLPGGVTCDEITIGPANTMGTLILTTAADAAVATAPLSVSAKATVAGKEVVRHARYGAALEAFQFAQANANVASVRSRMVDGIQLCVTDYDPAPMILSIGEGKQLETSRGGKLKIPFEVKRTGAASGNLNGFAIDFPPQTSVGTVGIGSREKGDFEMRFLANTPPGTYTFYLAGFNQGYRYARNPESAERAKKRQQRVSQILAEAQKTVQQRQREVNQNLSEVRAATNELNQAKSTTQKANQVVAAAELELKQAAVSLTRKQDAVAANAEDASLQSQATEAQSAVDVAKRKLESAKKAAADALNNQQLANAKLKSAEAASTKSDQELRSATEFQRKAQQEKQRADQFANQKRNESNPRNINIQVPSNSLTIKVTEFPVAVESLAGEATIKQGEKIEVPIKLTRLYDFNSAVNVQPRLPGGIGGISMQNANIAADKPEGKFAITAQSNAPVGQHDCTVRLQMNFNGQNLTMERPLKLTVVAQEPETAK